MTDSPIPPTTFFPPVLSRKTLDGKSTLDFGVYIHRWSALDRNLGLLKSIGVYVKKDGQLMTASGHGFHGDLNERGSYWGLMWWLDCPEEYKGFVRLGDNRMGLSAELYDRLAAEQERVWQTPEGQEMRAEDEARQAKERETERRVAEYHNKIRREGQKCLIWPSEMGWEHVWYLGWALEIPEDQRAKGTQWQGNPPKYAVLQGEGLPELRNTWLDPEMKALHDSLAPSDSNIQPLTDEQWDALIALSKSRVQAKRDAEEALIADAQAKREAAFAKARETGEPQVLSSELLDDDSIPDNSASWFTVYAMPDGTTNLKKTPTF